MNETDIPCSKCGADLVDRTVHPREVPVTTDRDGPVSVAECPRCEARYYPERTLSLLAGRPDRHRTPRQGE